MDYAALSPMSLQPLQTIYRQISTILPVDREEIFTTTKKNLENLEPSSSSRSFQLFDVRTYVASGKTLRTSGTINGVVVLPFATHWGVVIDETLYHLVFANQGDAESNVGRFARDREGHSIKFGYNSASDKVIESKIIGKTKYSHQELIKIGKALINAFGSYHRLFWNCQVFVECFLRFIADDDNNSSKRWTSVDASQIILCAFVVSLPVATTLQLKIKHEKRKQFVWEEMEKFIRDTQDVFDTTRIQSEEEDTKLIIRAENLLQDLAMIGGEEELSEWQEVPEGFWSKVRDYFAGYLRAATL